MTCFLCDNCSAPSMSSGYESRPLVHDSVLEGLDFTDQPAPAPEVPQQPTNDDDGDYPGYEDPRAEMPVDDEDMPPQSQQPEPDLDDGPIELGSGGHPPPAPPGGGTFVPVPEDDSEDLDMPYDPGNDEGGHPPGGGPLGPGPGFGPSPDEPPVQMEYHDEAPPPGGLLVRFLSFLIRIKS